MASAPFSYTSLPSGKVASVTIGAGAMQWLPRLGMARAYGVANPLNQLPSEGANPIVWDAPAGANSGNMASASLDGATTATAFTHDALNRMVAATKPGMAAAYEYDLDDRRSAKSVTMGATAITRTLWSDRKDSQHTLLQMRVWHHYPGVSLSTGVSREPTAGAGAAETIVVPLNERKNGE